MALKKYRVLIGGTTPFVMEALNLENLKYRIGQKFGKDFLEDRTFDAVEWREYTVAELIRELKKHKGGMKVFLPAFSGAKTDGQFHTVKGVSDAGGFICLESRAMPNYS